MRVIFHQRVTAGRKTGVGHYASCLLEALARHPDCPEIDRFPSGLPWYAWKTLPPLRDLWNRLNARGRGRLGLFRLLYPFAAVSPLLARQLRRLGHHLIDRQFQAAFAGNRHDLYHEPNFIPLRTELPTVVTIHDLSVLLYPEWHPPRRVEFFERGFQRGLRQCQQVIADSDTVRAEVIRYLNVPREQVTRVYPGIRSHLKPIPVESTKQVLRRLGLKPGYLLHVGTIEPRKNLETLLSAFCSLPAALRERCPLLLVGGWGWNFQAIANLYHLQGRQRGVRHLGYVAERYLPALYNGARALVYPSHYEGFGLPPLEMMACGGAVLASTADVFRETLGGHAHLVPTRDVDSWRGALTRVIADDDWWLSLRQGAVSHARRFSWDQSADATIQVYRKVGAAKEAATQRSEKVSLRPAA